MILTRLRLLTLLLILASVLWFGPPLLAVAGFPGIVPPTTKYKFTPHGTWPTHSIDVDKSSIYRTVDKDGDTLAGAVFRITVVQPVILGDKKINTFVNTIVGVCGADGVILIDSKAFGPDGKKVTEDGKIVAYEDKKQPSTPVTEAYNVLCGDVKVTPKEPVPSYKSKDRNTSTWI